MLRRDPFIRPLSGFAGELAATADWIVTAVRRPTPTGMQCPRRLEVFDWRGRLQASCEVDVGYGPLHIDERGTIWLATERALLGFDELARQQHRVEPQLADGATIDEFLPLGDGFVVACGGETAGTVIRLRADGTAVWTAALVPGMSEYKYPPNRSGLTKQLGPRPPRAWDPLPEAPLVVAGESLLVGFGQPHSGGAHQRSVLDLASGVVRWTSPTGPYTGAAALVPDGFLLGERFGEHAATTAIFGGAAVASWPIDGHMLVTDGLLWLVASGDQRGLTPALTTVPRNGQEAAHCVLPRSVRGTPCALAGRTIVLLCGQAWSRIDATGEIVEQRDLGYLSPVIGRVVTDNQGRFAFLMHPTRDLDQSQLWILDTGLPRLASGPWPCHGGDPAHRARWDEPGRIFAPAGPPQASSGTFLWAHDELIELYHPMHRNRRRGRPALPAETWTEIDAQVDAALHRLAQSGLKVVLILDDKPAEACASSVYVFFEPLAHVVLAIGGADHSAAVSANADLWHAHQPALIELQDRVEHLLRQGRLADALLAAADGLRVALT